MKIAKKSLKVIN